MVRTSSLISLVTSSAAFMGVSSKELLAKHKDHALHDAVDKLVDRVLVVCHRVWSLPHVNMDDAVRDKSERPLSLRLLELDDAMCGKSGSLPSRRLLELDDEMRAKCGIRHADGSIFGSINEATLKSWLDENKNRQGNRQHNRTLLLFHDVLGTRGDNQPYIILAVEAAIRLRETHDVLLIIRSSFEGAVRSLLQDFRKRDTNRAYFDNLKVLVTHELEAQAARHEDCRTVHNLDDAYDQMSEDCAVSHASRSSDATREVLTSARMRDAEKLQRILGHVVRQATQHAIIPHVEKAYGDGKNIVYTGVDGQMTLANAMRDNQTNGIINIIPQSAIEKSLSRGVSQIWRLDNILEFMKAEPKEWDRCQAACMRVALSLSQSLSPRIKHSNEEFHIGLFGQTGDLPVLGPILDASPNFDPIYRRYMPAVQELQEKTERGNDCVSDAKRLLDETSISEATRNWILQEKFIEGRRLVCIAISGMSLTSLLFGEMDALARRSSEENFSVLAVHKNVDKNVAPFVGRNGFSLLGSPYEPFQFLFPFCDIVVTHGGLTRHQAVASLTPMVLVPYGMADQSEVCADLEYLGLGKQLPAEYFLEKREAQTVLADTIVHVLSNRTSHLTALRVHRECLLNESASAVDEALDFVVYGKYQKPSNAKMAECMEMAECLRMKWEDVDVW